MQVHQSAVTPTILNNLGLIGGFPDPGVSSLSYRIWTVPCCDLTARAAEGLRELGCLTVDWQTDDDGNGRLTARQRLLLEESNAYEGCLIHSLTARCASDGLPALQRWELTTSFLTADGRAIFPPGPNTARSMAAASDSTVMDRLKNGLLRDRCWPMSAC